METRYYVIDALTGYMKGRKCGYVNKLSAERRAAKGDKHFQVHTIRVFAPYDPR